MAIFRGKGTKKASSGRFSRHRKKRKVDLGGYSALTKIGELKKRIFRNRGGNTKVKLLNVSDVNVYDPKEKKYSKVKIKTVVESPANRHFVRRGIITKGSIIETEKGKAKITSRPGQDSVLNAVLIN